ncbi:MAG: GAF domain-containing sensor histidine kinase [Phormidesmis sp.]
MSAIASPEFVSLCRTQLRLLTQQITGSSAALYIAEFAQRADLSDDLGQSNFVPVVSYPEPVDSWVTNFARATTWGNTHSGYPLALPGSRDGLAAAPFAPDDSADDSAVKEAVEEPAFGWPDRLHPEQQLVVPLVYTEVVVGLLVSVRRDRIWQSEERSQVESVAESLAAGCVLERRNQWLQGQLSAKRGLQSRQSEIFHNLLHQFRNPLTAVSTFGQLLVKRLEPEDTNRPVATSLVRESKRLRELVTHFDEAVAIGDADLAAGESASEPSGKSSGPLLSASPALLPHSSDDSSQLRDRPQPNGTGLGHLITLSPQYIPDIVEPALAVAGIVATEKGVHLHPQVAVDTPPVWGEEEALGEVVSNLIDNAIKYSPVGAHVWVQTGVSRLGSQANDDRLNYQSHHYQGIVVGDTGPGIPAADLARLFERNYRGVQAESDIPGTGLGLAIARSLVQEMHGYIEVISPAADTPWLPKFPEKAGGAGTVFIIWLLEVDRA